MTSCAGKRPRRERPGRDLQATALAHEAYLRLLDAEEAWKRYRPGLLFAAAEAVRRIPVGAARPDKDQKPGGGAARSMRVAGRRLKAAPCRGDSGPPQRSAQAAPGHAVSL